MRSLVLASHNAKKAAELETMLSPLNWRVTPVSAFSDVEPQETGISFVENALIKARHACEASGLPAIADDSGLCVDALDGAPGVRSARYAGDTANDASNNAKLLQAMQEIADHARGAAFVCVLVYLRHRDDPLPLICQGVWRGQILRQARGEAGFGYDPLFLVPDQNCASAELEPAHKNRISHRAIAMRKMCGLLQHEPG